MTPADLLTDAFDRVAETVTAVLDGVTDDQLTARPGGTDSGANPIAWLVWHLTRVQDDHVAEVAGTEQVWTAQGFRDSFGLDLDAAATGYGMSSDEVARVRAPAELLGDYHRAVHESTTAYLRTVGDADLDRVVDDAWDPPVTLGARLVSVVNDDTQHAGQAAYVRGLVSR